MTRLHSRFLLPGLLLVLFWFSVQPASAHAVPILSSPQANAILDETPAELWIRFNEPVVPALSRVQVLTQAGQALATGPAEADAENRTLTVSLPSLAQGPYLVSWQALSAVDGHTTSGTFSFGVGTDALTAALAQSETTVVTQFSPLSATARWFTLTGIALVLGFFAFRLLVWNPIFTGVELAVAEELVDRRHSRTGLKIAAAGLSLIGIGLLLTLVYQSSMYDLWRAGHWQTWLATRFGSMWLARLVLTGLAAVHVTWLLMGQRYRSMVAWQWWAGLLLAIGLALTSSLISHSAALLQNTWLATAVDLVHTLAAGVWVGGLVYLALGLWQGRALSPEPRTWLNLSLVLNFSALAAAAVGLLLISGGYLAWQHVASWTALVSTAYGFMLLAKFGLALPAFAIASINLLLVKPRLDAAYEEPDTESSARSMARFGRLVRLEAVFALLILVAAGFLADMQRGVDAPRLTDSPGQVALIQTADDLTITLTIEPALVGQNSFDVALVDTAGNAVDATDVSLRYTFLDQGIGADEGQASALGNGRYRLEGSYISLIGNWQVEVSIRRPDAFDTFVPFRLQAGLGGQIQSQDSGARPLERLARFLTLAGGLATGGGMVLLAIGWGLVAIRAARTEWQLVPLLAISVAVLWLGAMQIFTFFEREYTPARFLTNPILPDAESITVGRSLYEENCISCHGREGRGDGASGAMLNPPPADFTGGHTDTHPDGDLYYWIREGIDNSAMPAYGDYLTGEEMWHLVNYIRRLSAQAAR